MKKLWLRIRVLLTRDRFDRDLEEEIQAHLEMQAEENQEGGMSAEEARYAAQRQFGNATLLRERSREAWGWPAFEGFLRDIRFAVRALRRSPSFSVLAILMLALGIGANTAAFSVIRGVLLRPLAFHDPDRLVMVWDQWPKRGDDRILISGAEFSAWQAQSRSVENVAAIQGSSQIINVGDEPTQIPGVRVSAGFFKTLGVTPAAGRVFSSEEHRESGHGVAVIGWGLAQRLGGNMVGKTIRLNREPNLVVGVMPRGFGFPNDSEVWVPLPSSSLGPDDSNDHNFRVIARLKAGFSVLQARNELQGIAWPFQRTYSASLGTGVTLVSLREQIIGDAGRALFALLGVVACLLLIACANVANLSLSRAAGRRREIALRLSLGASRSRIIRFLLAESVVLSLSGAALGFAGAWWGVRAFVLSNPIDLPRVQEIAIDRGVLLFTLGVAFATALVVGLAPALRISQPDLNTSLKDAAGTRGGLQSNRARLVLAAAQVSLAVVMLSGAGLLLRSFIERINVPLGFRPEGTLGVELPPWANRTLDQLLENIRAIPGVQTAGAGTAFPHEPPGTTSGFEIEGRPNTPGENVIAGKMVVTPEYFTAAGMTQRKGRFTSAADGPGAPAVAVISEALQRRYFAGNNPIGRRIRWGDQPWLTVVGVVSDVKGFGVDGPPLPAIYMPRGQQGWGNGVYVVARTSVPPLSLASTVRKEVRSWSKTVMIGRLAPLEDLLAHSLAVPRFYLLLVGAFAAIAAIIAAVGVYGTLNYMVAQRRHEIAIRIALGAGREDLVAMIAGQGLAVVLAGIAFGLAGAWIFSKALASLLFKVPPGDFATLAAASVFLGTVGLLACYIPARRATSTDPIQALHYE